MTAQQNTTAYIAGFEDGKRASVRLIEEAVKAEREACAKVCEHEWSNAAEREFGEQCAAIIRGREARGQA